MPTETYKINPDGTVTITTNEGIKTTYGQQGNVVSSTLPQAPMGVTPQEQQQIAQKGGGVLQTTGATYDIKPTQEAIEKYEEKEVSKTVGEPVTYGGGFSSAKYGAEGTVFYGKSGTEYFYNPVASKIFYDVKQAPTPQDAFKQQFEQQVLMSGINYNPFTQQYFKIETIKTKPTYEDFINTRLEYQASNLTPLETLAYAFYNPFQLRTSIAGLKGIWEGKSPSEVKRIMFEQGQLAFKQQAFYKPVEFTENMALNSLAISSLPASTSLQGIFITSLFNVGAGEYHLTRSMVTKEATLTSISLDLAQIGLGSLGVASTIHSVNPIKWSTPTFEINTDIGGKVINSLEKGTQTTIGKDITTSIGTSQASLWGHKLPFYKTYESISFGDFITNAKINELARGGELSTSLNMITTKLEANILNRFYLMYDLDSSYSAPTILSGSIGASKSLGANFESLTLARSIVFTGSDINFNWGGSKTMFTLTGEKLIGSFKVSNKETNIMARKYDIVGEAFKTTPQEYNYFRLIKTEFPSYEYTPTNKLGMITGRAGFVSYEPVINTGSGGGGSNVIHGWTGQSSGFGGGLTSSLDMDLFPKQNIKTSNGFVVTSIPRDFQGYDYNRIGVTGINTGIRNINRTNERVGNELNTNINLGQNINTGLNTNVGTNLGQNQPTTLKQITGVSQGQQQAQQTTQALKLQLNLQLNLNTQISIPNQTQTPKTPEVILGGFDFSNPTFINKRRVSMPRINLKVKKTKGFGSISLPVADLLSINESLRKTGKATFLRSPKATREFNRRMETQGVFMRFPTKELAKIRGRF